MAAFLDADGLNLFYSLIAAKFGAGAATGSMDYSKATYTGDGKPRFPISLIFRI